MQFLKSCLELEHCQVCLLSGTSGYSRVADINASEFVAICFASVMSGVSVCNLVEFSLLVMDGCWFSVCMGLPVCLGIWPLQGSFSRAFAMTTLCGCFSPPETLIFSGRWFV